MIFNSLNHTSMKHAKIHVEGINNFVKQFRVFFLKHWALEFLVGDGLTLFFCTFFRAVDGLGVLDNYVEPDVGLYLFYHVGELQGWDHFDRLRLISKRLKKGNDSFRNSALLPPLMNINRIWMKKQNFSICVLLLLRFFCLWLECWVNDEHWANC